MLDRGAKPARPLPPGVGIKGLAWYLGETLPIATQPDLAADPVRLAAFQARGFANYSRSAVDASEMAVRSCRVSLQRAGLSAADVDAVLVGWTEHRSFDDMQERLANRIVRDLGFHAVHLTGVAMVGCTCFAALLRMGRNLLAAEGYRHVLVVETNRCRDDNDRLVMPDCSVYSDGAASCVVTTEAPEFALRSVLQLANANPNHQVIGSTAAAAHRADMSRAVFERALRHAGIGREDVRQYFAPNHASHLVRPYAKRLGIPLDRVFEGNTSRHGHPWSADTVVNLATFCAEQGCTAGDVYAALAWAEGSFSTLVLERTAQALRLEDSACALQT